jgi:hypothetical protein
MDFSYIGAFLDGEGSISEQSGPTHGWVISMAQSTHQAQVFISMRAFLASHGIKAAIYTTPQSGRRASMSRLNIFGLHNGLEFLRCVRPHLHVKAASADRAMAAMKERVDFWRNRADTLRAALLEYRPGMSTRALAKKYGIKWKRLKINLLKAGIEIPDVRPKQSFTLPCGHLVHTSARNRKRCDICQPKDPARQHWINAQIQITAYPYPRPAKPAGTSSQQCD